MDVGVLVETRIGAIVAIYGPVTSLSRLKIDRNQKHDSERLKYHTSYRGDGIYAIEAHYDNLLCSY